MNKSEMVRRFKNAQDVEQEAQEQAQWMADATAAELEGLARSMYDITEKMHSVLLQVAKVTKESGEISRSSAKELSKTVEAMRETAQEWALTAGRWRQALAGYSLRLLAAVALGAAVGSVSAILLLHYWPELTNRIAPNITIDTDQLASQIITRWQHYQQGNAGAATTASAK